MKHFKHVVVGVIASGIVLTFISCEHKIKVTSAVHEDGSIDRSIVLYGADSAKVANNFFGVGKKTGWDTTVEPEPKGDSGKFTASYHKLFPSAAAANAEMNTATDTLFSIRSDFEKKFRWFYTYIRYSDTYVALNHFKRVKTEDYFTTEDYAFINRLPVEGKTISRADSLYLSALNNKIFDQFATRAMFEEYFQVLITILDNNKADAQWTVKLNARKEEIYRQLTKKGSDDLEDDWGVALLIDSLHVPLPKDVVAKHYKELSAGVEKRISFASDANSGKYTHVVSMPWEVVDSNADSVHANELFWRPPVTKFLLNDYTMYAESRQLNLWAMIVSGVIVIATVFVVYKRRGIN